MPIRRARPAARRGRTASALWLAIPLILIVATRGDTRDTANYVEIFRATTDFPAWPSEYYGEFGVEWGFGLLSWLVGSVGLGPRSLFAIISAATFFFMLRTARLFGLSFYYVMPFYLGSFFLTQQLMQVRQGLGVAIAFWSVAGFVSLGSRKRLLLGAAAGSLAHIVAVLPPVAALLLHAWLPTPRPRRIAVWALALTGLAAAAAVLATDLEAFQLLERISLYASDEEYGSARSLLDPANVRAALVLAVLLLAARSPQLSRSRSYVVLLGLYALHIGLRIGFLDVQILSGRLSTALGFAEVFLLPMALGASVRSPRLRALLAVSYLAAQVTATLSLQIPFLVDDYFAPLYADHSAR